MKRVFAGIAVILALYTGSAHALNFDTASGDQKITISIKGPIETGDGNRFRTLIGSLSSDTIIVKLDSDGGSVREAVIIAATVKQRHLVTLVPPRADCASACFFIFAAGARRYAADSAFIGVHSASTRDFGEDDAAKSVTVEIARFLSEELGVPDSIIGKIVKTPAKSVSRLSESDLTAMGVKLLYDDLATVIVPPTAPPKPALPYPKPVLIRPQQHAPFADISVCGRPISYTIASDSAGFTGIWTGNWNNAIRLCGGLIVEKIEANGLAKVIYVYGPSSPRSKVSWKQQTATSLFSNGILTFKDDDGSNFTFFCAGAEGLRAVFEGRSGKLSALFQRLLPSTGPLASVSPETSPMFQQGLADRTAFQQWVDGFSGEFRAGIEWWASQRSATHPPSCDGTPEFFAGCNEAKARLVPFDVLRKRDPDYKAGWSSFKQT